MFKFLMTLNYVPGTKPIDWVNSNITMSCSEKLCSTDIPKVFQSPKSRVLIDIS